METTIGGDYEQDLIDFFNGDPPAWVEGAGCGFLRLKVSDWQSSKSLTVKVDDVVRYYAGDAHNISSGCRSLAGHTGDWRQIDELAKICLEWFKLVNPSGLEESAKSHGLSFRK